MNFAETVKSVREQLNQSQQELANALNMNVTTINRWENGHITPSPLAQKVFIDFCEDNFINVSHLKTTQVNK